MNSASHDSGAGGGGETSWQQLHKLVQAEEEGAALAAKLTNEGTGPAAKKKKAHRLESLDVARGLTIAMMIFVDNVGDSWAYVDHTAWNGLRLADFVMPSFDVIVGIAVVFSLKGGRLKAGDAEAADQPALLAAALKRAAKLFVLGVFTQSGTPFPTLDLKR